jgi:hypothetical protein
MTELIRITPETSPEQAAQQLSSTRLSWRDRETRRHERRAEQRQFRLDARLAFLEARLQAQNAESVSLRNSLSSLSAQEVSLMEQKQAAKQVALLSMRRGDQRQVERLEAQLAKVRNTMVTTIARQRLIAAAMNGTRAELQANGPLKQAD